MGDRYYNCSVCGTPLHHINEACPDCLPKMAERPPTYYPAYAYQPCPSCAALRARLREVEEERDRLRAAVEWALEHGDVVTIFGSDEPRRNWKEELRRRAGKNEGAGTHPIPAIDA